jgi:hypothetical protein
MQLRTFFAASVVGLALACLAGSAGAQQIYKWKDANRVTPFCPTPPPTRTHYTKVHLTNAPEVSSNPPSPPASAEADTGAPPQANAATGTQPDTPANRAELCKQLNSNIALLNSKQPVITGGSNGKQVVMSDNQREQQLATARAQQAQYCASKSS